MLSSAAQLLVLDDSDDDDDDTSLTTAYVGVVVRVQGLGRGWLVRKHARLAKAVSKLAWVLWCRFELRLLDSIGTEEIAMIDEVLKAVYGPDVLQVD